MIIKLSPQRRDDTIDVVKAGVVFIVNGESFDFSPMTEGATLPRSAITSEWFADDVQLQDGQLCVTLLLPLPENFSQAQAFPAPLVDVPDGPVAFPLPLSLPETQTEVSPE